MNCFVCLFTNYSTGEQKNNMLFRQNQIENHNVNGAIREFPFTKQSGFKNVKQCIGLPKYIN